MAHEHRHLMLILDIANGVEDAIYHLGGRIVDSHMPPELVLRAIQAGSAGGPAEMSGAMDASLRSA